ncbi:MAG: zinc ribbon domain-containing protein [Actinomycetota bacterium]|nr:zinc ribbon domain-containing protein [Actinomycetota bacterium]
MAHCRACGSETNDEFRFCPWCATPQRRKLVEFFRGVDTDPVRALRVSRYIPEKLVRFSVWDETGTVRAAVSLDEEEAARLAEFVATPTRRTRLLDDLRSLVRR